MNAHETPIMTLLRDAPDQSTIRRALALTSPEELESLYAAAYEVKTQQVGRTVYFRGIIEMSNICRKDCLYCGIRSSNRSVRRFTMSEDEVLNAAHWAMEAQYGSIVIQTGEWTSPAFAETIEQIIRRIKEESNGTLGITLSLGEQSPETYKRWFKAGAHRYLLRIETSNPELYARIHPPDHLFDARVECLSALREIGYQVGTGVMIGVPGQTLDDLAGDVQFFMDLDVDMIGMGPYIPHADTPMGASSDGFDPEEQLTLGLKMIAVCRIAMPTINIAATTALQALNPTGRELGLQAGANIIMPNLTDTRYRDAYQLYDNKPCLDENAQQCRGCLARRIESIGEAIGLGNWGDAPHFFARTTEDTTTAPEPYDSTKQETP